MRLPAELMNVNSQMYSALSGTGDNTQDSLMLQLSGTKRLTLIDPLQLRATYPIVQDAEYWQRVRPGSYHRRRPGGRAYDMDRVAHFPLVNVTHPDLVRHPRFASVRPIVVTLEPGDALLLPVHWLHQVDSRGPTLVLIIC